LGFGSPQVESTRCKQPTWALGFDISFGVFQGYYTSNALFTNSSNIAVVGTSTVYLQACYTSIWPVIRNEIAFRGESQGLHVDRTLVFGWLCVGRGIGNVMSGPLS
jgi:hypothetical protein